MKALILASGQGKRLKPLTDHVPKPLLSVGEKTILDYQLEALMGNGFEQILITTGPFEEKIKQYVLGNYTIDVQFVHNPSYETTNYIYTLWLTKDFIDDDVILLHGDLLFDDNLIAKLKKAEQNRVLINRGIEPPKKDFKALIEEERVVEIGVDVFGQNAYFCAPMYKMAKTDFLRWIDEMEIFINRGKEGCYAEDAFNEISHEILLKPLYFDEFCIEIDTKDDFEQAKNWSRK